MKLLATLSACAAIASASLLVDFNATRGDDPSVLGLLNLEAARGATQSANSADLYFKKGADWQGNPAGHAGRIAGDIRAEYHGLKGKTSAGTTYWLGYTFALQEIEDSLMIWQWKEYSANAHGGANIPLAMEVRDNAIQFQWQASGDVGRVAQYTMPVSDHTVYTIGMEIYADADQGTWRLWINGQPITFSTTGTDVVTGNMYPGQSEPKWGAYRGEAVAINTWIYDVQVGTSEGDLHSKYFA